MSMPVFPHAVVHQPLEGRPLAAHNPASAQRLVIKSALHTVTDMLSQQTYTRGADARGIYANFSGQYCLRSASEFGLYPMSAITIFFELLSSADGIVAETGATYVSNDGLQIYHENSTGRFYVSTSSAGGTFTQKYFTRPAAGEWHSYALFIDRGLGAGAVVAAAYVDLIPQTFTTALASGGAGGTFAAQQMNLMSRNAGASLTLTGRLKNFHVLSGWATLDDVANYVLNPYSVFAIEPPLLNGPGLARPGDWFLTM